MSQDRKYSTERKKKNRDEANVWKMTTNDSPGWLKESVPWLYAKKSSVLQYTITLTKQWKGAVKENPA